MELSDRDRDLAIRTIIGEAANQGPVGMQAVGNVILNRAQRGGYGSGVAGVVLKPRQFEPWSTRRSELMALQPGTAKWNQAAEALDRAMAEDVTKGATHFANIGTVQQRGDAAGKAGGWLARMGNRTRIGSHTFGNADGKGTGGPTDTRVVDAGIGTGGTGGQAPAGMGGGDAPMDPRRVAVQGLIKEMLADALAKKEEPEVAPQAAPQQAAPQMTDMMKLPGIPDVMDLSSFGVPSTPQAGPGTMDPFAA